MPIKLIAIDIDGTLLDSHWRIPDANREAIAEAVARRIEVVLVTGRRYDFARPAVEGLPRELNLIVNNGALIKSMDGKSHFRCLLPRSTARKVLDATLEFRPLASLVFDRPKARQIVLESIRWDDVARRSYYERNREFLAEHKPLEEALDEDPIQVMFTGAVDRMRAVRRILESAAYAKEYTLALTEYEDKDFSILDVISPSCSKGSTLEEWARRRGIARQEVMAVGDNWNDHDMLEFAGLAVVMGNSVPELKTRGWPVTLTNDEGGLAAAIRTYVFEQ